MQALGRYDIVKTYPARGPLQQYRLAAVTAFGCFRCGQDKTSKLVTVLDADWQRLLCNGCYGRLLSIHEIKAGSGPDDERAEALAQLLLELVPADEQRRAEAALRVQDDRAEVLQPTSLRQLATATYVAEVLANRTGLDWSAAVIGPCKAVEIELVARLIEPLRAACAAVDLTPDVADNDLGRVARYCAGKTDTPPELGAISHFLRTAAHSKTRRETSPLLGALRGLMRQWPASDWLLQPDGAIERLSTLGRDFRNPAAHTNELDRTDWDRCRTHVIGADGLLWRLVLATTP
jgi:hypothetical protein